MSFNIFGTWHKFRRTNKKVRAHKHVNGGGWVANTANVSASVRVEGSAEVYDNAIVSGNVVICEEARVYGNVVINVNENDFCRISGSAKIYEKANINSTAFISGFAEIYGQAKLTEGVIYVENDAEIYGNARLSSDSNNVTIINGTAKVFSYAHVKNSTISKNNIGGSINIFNGLIDSDNNVFLTTRSDSNNNVFLATRSDGYIFTTYRDRNNENIIHLTAGCRHFTSKQDALNHWMKTRFDSILGIESIMLVNHLYAMHSVQEN